MEKEVYSTIDTFLKYLIAQGTGEPINFDTRTTIGVNAINLMDEYSLISYRSVQRSQSYVDITITGEKVINYGGIEKYIYDKKSEKYKRDKLDEMKLIYDVSNSKRIYKTYWWTFWMSVIAFLISTGLLISKIIETK